MVAYDSGSFRNTASLGISFPQLTVDPFSNVGLCGIFFQPFFDSQFDGTAQITLLSAQNCDDGQSKSAFGLVRKNYEHFSQRPHYLKEAMISCRYKYVKLYSG